MEFHPLNIKWQNQDHLLFGYFWLNSTFSAANEDVEKYEKMFPDSAIAKNYQQKATEGKYKPQPGVALWIQNIAQRSTFNNLFSGNQKLPNWKAV